MLEIIQVDSEEHNCHVRKLFEENFSLTNLMISREFDVSFDVNAFLEQEMAKLQQFYPPSGCLLLAKYEGRIAGCACLRKISNDVGEVKTMYVRPEYRKKGIGRSLLQAIIYQARFYGYAKVKLECAPFAKEAQALYHSVGFHNIEPYPESEIPEKYYPHWVFMVMVF